MPTNTSQLPRQAPPGTDAQRTGPAELLMQVARLLEEAARTDLELHARTLSELQRLRDELDRLRRRLTWLSSARR